MAKSFSLQLAKFAEKAGRNADLVIRKVGIDMTSRIVLRTPVDTGRARANWQVSIGARAIGVVDATDKTGSATIGLATQKLANFKAGPSIWITNGLPYIGKLEDGHSSQSSGMVARTVVEFQGLVSKAAVEVSR